MITYCYINLGQLLLANKIQTRGVLRPIVPEVYIPGKLLFSSLSEISVMDMIHKWDTDPLVCIKQH